MIPFASNHLDRNKKACYDKRLHQDGVTAHNKMASSSCIHGCGCHCSPPMLRAPYFPSPTNGYTMRSPPTLPCVPFNHPSRRYSFVPLHKKDIARTEKVNLAVAPSNETGYIPSFEFKTLSPTPSTHTLDTLESFSFGHSESSGSPLSNRSTTDLSSSSFHELSSLQRAMLRTPESHSYPTYPDVCCYSGLDYSQPPLTRKPFSSPRTLEQDTHRQNRMKTELCLHYINKTECPFGSACTYAHGEEELQKQTLMDLHDSGLIDVSTYRTLPCLAFVSTGSCPFGKRCHAIHDPRVAGNHKSWLPHTETQGNTIETDINVDALHQKRLYSILHNNPFGALLNLESASFDDLYSLVCNSEKTFLDPVSNGRKKKGTLPFLQEEHILSIALKMRGGSNFQFKYRPQHIIYDKLCMILQKRAFRVTHEEAVEIPISIYRPGNDILVREIAFGPDSDPSVRGVGLWFAIDQSDVTECTPQQAKRYRWKRQPNNKKAFQTPQNENLDGHSKFDMQDSFTMIRPSEHDAYHLSTAILNHRLAVIKSNHTPNICERAIALDRLDQQRKKLKESFEAMRIGWNNWSWPINEGRESLDENAVVPPVDGYYNVDMTHSKAVVDIWESFVTFNINTIQSQNQDEEQEFTFPTNKDLDLEASRLRVLKTLAEGNPVRCDGDGRVLLPHIKGNRNCFTISGSQTPQSRRCWRALLLKSVSKDCNEWDIVRDHFQKSRSRTVLSIVQQ